jgi:hypothetical protein
MRKPKGPKPPRGCVHRKAKFGRGLFSQPTEPTDFLAAPPWRVGPGAPKRWPAKQPMGFELARVSAGQFYGASLGVRLDRAWLYARTGRWMKPGEALEFKRMPQLPPITRNPLLTKEYLEGGSGLEGCEKLINRLWGQVLSPKFEVQGILGGLNSARPRPSQGKKRRWADRRNTTAQCPPRNASERGGARKCSRCANIATPSAF